MPRNTKITFTEVERKRFFKLQDKLDSGILGPIVASFFSGGVAYILTDSGETALKVVGGIYFVAVWLNRRIKQNKNKEE